MDLGFILLALALIGAVLFVVLQPFLEPQKKNQPRSIQAADELAAEREGILNTLRDLDFDHSTGKLTDEEHAAQRAQLITRGAEVLKQLEALGMPVEDEGDAEAAIEHAIAARRKVASPSANGSARVCPVCHATATDADRFCASCGAVLTRACPQCSAAVSVDDRFCGQCGTPMLAEVAQ